MQIDSNAWTALLAKQDQVVSRRQAFGVGWTPTALDHRLGRDWQALLPGVILTVTGIPTERQRLRAALLWAGGGAALTGLTGLAGHGLDVEPSTDLHVAVRHARQINPVSFRSGGGRVVPHRTRRDLSRQYGDPPRLGVARCVVDACLRERSAITVRGLVSAAVQLGKTTVEEVAAELALAPSAGSKVLRQVLGEVGEGARSAAEATLVPALRAAKIPPYRLNVDVFDDSGRWLARPDVVFEEIRLIVEVDGARWHFSPGRLVSDIERHTRLEAAGWVVLRYPASQVLTDPEGVVAEVAVVARRLAARVA